MTAPTVRVAERQDLYEAYLLLLGAPMRPESEHAIALLRAAGEEAHG